MTEPKRFSSPTGRLVKHEYKVPTMMEWGTYKRQAEAYAQAFFDAYRETYPMPVGDEVRPTPTIKTHHTVTMDWWRHFAGEPVLINKLRGRQKALFSFNDLIHPETIEAMTPPTPGCGCVR